MSGEWEAFWAGYVSGVMSGIGIVFVVRGYARWMERRATGDATKRKPRQ